MRMIAAHLCPVPREEPLPSVRTACKALWRTARVGRVPFAWGGQGGWPRRPCGRSEAGSLSWQDSRWHWEGQCPTGLARVGLAAAGRGVAGFIPVAVRGHWRFVSRGAASAGLRGFWVENGRWAHGTGWGRVRRLVRSNSGGQRWQFRGPVPRVCSPAWPMSGRSQRG